MVTAEITAKLIGRRDGLLENESWRKRGQQQIQSKIRVRTPKTNLTKPLVESSTL